MLAREEIFSLLIFFWGLLLTIASSQVRILGIPSDLSPRMMCSWRYLTGSSSSIHRFRIGSYCLTREYLWSWMKSLSADSMRTGSGRGAWLACFTSEAMMSSTAPSTWRTWNGKLSRSSSWFYLVRKTPGSSRTFCSLFLYDSSCSKERPAVSNSSCHYAEPGPELWLELTLDTTDHLMMDLLDGFYVDSILNLVPNHQVTDGIGLVY